MQQSQYINKLASLCSPHSFGANAVEWFILTGQVQLCWNDIEHDLRVIMGQPGQPDTGLYDRICEEYQSFCRRVTIEGNEVSPEQAEVYYATSPHVLRFAL